MSDPGDVDDDDGGDEVVFELADWDADARARLSEQLDTVGITHAWEDGDLVVADGDGDATEDAIETIEYPDSLPADDGSADVDASADVDDTPVENEGTYEVMSALFVAADRLQHAPEDPVVGAEFDAAAETVADSGPPYGIDAQVWQQVQELASNVCDQLDEADPDVIARDAAALRQLLSRYV